MLLGPLFDTVGRKPMIAGTYIISGTLLIAGGLVRAFLGIEVAQKNLEEIAKPLSASADDDDGRPPERTSTRRPAASVG